VEKTEQLQVKSAPLRSDKVAAFLCFG